VQAQVKAITSLGTGRYGKKFRRRYIKQPTLVVNGDNDTMGPTSNSIAPFEKIRDAQLSL
jgi:hypothetical protein